MTRLGLLGGTFDPPHYGHLVGAQEAAWRLGLDQVLFLPARQNPLKQGEFSSPAEDRVRMVELTIQGDERFVLSRADLDRPPPSYTVDLLRLLRASYGPDTEFYFLGGADLLPELHAWYQPDVFLQLATLVVVSRPGWPEADVDAFAEDFPAARGRVIALRTPGLDISATDLRQRVARGEPIRYLMPPAVEAYIHQHGLYREGPVVGQRRGHNWQAATP
jgi:nicotinate-nucleotide adenylyltransferase